MGGRDLIKFRPPGGFSLFSGWNGGMDGEKVGAMKTIKFEWDGNKAGYTATPVACGWAGAVIEVN